MLFCCLSVTLRILVINSSSSSPVNNKRCRLSAISVTNFPRPVPHFVALSIA